MKRIPQAALAVLVSVSGALKAPSASAELTPIWIDDILIFVGARPNPILFVTQVPVLNDFTSRGSASATTGPALRRYRAGAT